MFGFFWAAFLELPIWPKIDFPYWKLGWGTLCSFYFVIDRNPCTFMCLGRSGHFGEHWNWEELKAFCFVSVSVFCSSYIGLCIMGWKQSKTESNFVSASFLFHFCFISVSFLFLFRNRKLKLNISYFPA